MAIPVVDLFAGPGGLNEGFSSFKGDGVEPTFQNIASFEMDASACQTLTVRGAFRRAQRAGSGLDTYYRLLRGEVTLAEVDGDPSFREALAASRAEVHHLELGPETRRLSNRLMRDALKLAKVDENAVWALVGGPPCQAYSLAGRSRRTRDVTFEGDKKHFLYREYLNILATFRPPIFVMENVKGLLSSKHSGLGMFERIIDDLSAPSGGVRYSIHSFTQIGSAGTLRPDDFVVRAEDYGVPQRRHRVLLLGLREDLQVRTVPQVALSERTTVRDAIGDLPALRSGLSKSPDDLEAWLSIRNAAAQAFPRNGSGRQRTRLSRGGEWLAYPTPSASASPLARWLEDPAAEGIAQHATRGHMSEDLIRYWFAANYGLRHGVSPTLRDFPNELLPLHANASAENRPFEDRFRVQLWDSPSTTVVSHIAKDGNYYIHPDPDQMRSLTVREAARLQTFPDNYLFMGNRTSQYAQVGNAVPPLLAHKIAEIVAQVAIGL
ncbi:MAG: DNA (cytosine-5-)-methyltransferase [Actinomycetota bacterium]|nr:DNA (cytosine-5-)-methyltransferase [Actinomycetota bacterium]